eukprot:EG_transcript_4022
MSCDGVDRRAKLYFLDESGNWEHRSTGDIFIFQDGSDHLLILKSEDLKDDEGSPKVVLTTRISSDDIYQRQQDSFIVWNDPWLEQEMAVSFQSASGCSRIWNEIQAVQGKPTSSNASDASLAEEFDLKLPEPSIPSLKEICDIILGSWGPSVGRGTLGALLLSESFLDKLLDVFEQCEDVEDMDSLHLLFDIFKSMVLMNHIPLLKVLFSDKYLLLLMGIFEYDPELPARPQHRKYLQHVVVFKELIALDPEVKQKIHQVYRLQYLRDTVLPRALDDAVGLTLNHFVAATQNDILLALYQDKAFLRQLFERFDTEVDEDRICDLIAFCQELIGLAKALSPALKSEFYTTMSSHGLFDAIGRCMNHPNPKARLSAVHILWQAAHQEASVLRTFMLSEEQRMREDRFLRTLVAAVVDHADDSLKGQVVDVLRVLVDAGDGTLPTAFKPPELNDFLRLVYAGAPSIMELLCNPVLHPKPGQAVVQYHVLELVAACVAAHTHHMVAFVLRTNLVGKALSLLRADLPTHLQCAIVRLVKVVVAARNDQYNQHLMKQNHFAPLVELYLHAGPARYNLVTSAVLSVFEFIRSENVKLLLCHLVENFAPLFEAGHPAEVFADLKRKYEQHKFREMEREAQQQEEERQASARQTAAPFHDLRDDEDEEYFNEEAAPQAEEPEAAAPRAPPKPRAAKADAEEEGLCLVVGRAREKSPAVRPSPARKEPPRRFKVRRLETGTVTTTPVEGEDMEADGAEVPAAAATDGGAPQPPADTQAAVPMEE